jgi:hypothetical protein
MTGEDLKPCSLPHRPTVQQYPFNPSLYRKWSRYNTL